MKKVKLLVAMLLVLVMAVPFVLTACNPSNPTPGGDDVKYEQIDMADVVEREDYTSVYSVIGADVTIDQVEEDKLTGLAYVTVDGVKYELGMDFLSMAMVYNTTPAGEFKTADDVYNEWWRLYIQRWNYLVPEVPLYSNKYYDVYNAKISEFQTTPYWSPETDIVGASSTDGKVNLGNSTELSGSFRNSSFGKSSPGASDLSVQELTSGYSTIVTDEAGAIKWAGESIVKSHSETLNKDGTLTYTIEIANNLKFSDGSAITAKNYLYSVMAGSTKVMGEASGSQQAGMYYVGYETFNEATESGVVFSGLRLLDTYKFSVTVTPDYANYYYATLYASFGPSPKNLYFPGEVDIADDGQGCYITGDYFAKSGENYALAATIETNVMNTNASDIPYSGPYYVSDWNASTSTVTLKKNAQYLGDHRGQGNIETITIRKIESATQTDLFETGQIDILAGVTGAAETEAALALVAQNPDKFRQCSYDRAGYGKLAFACDFGATMFTEVRQAVMYTINRTEFMKSFTGDHGKVVHGPYYEGSAAFVANKDIISLSTYDYNVNSAIEVLEEGGWIYNGQGKEFDASKDAVRYKKLSGYELTAYNLNFASTDGKYKTVKINGEYYMPLVINWTGTQPNSVTDLLRTSWQKSADATTKIGMYITYKSGEFNQAVYGDYYRMESQGFTGTASCGAVNFATGFTSSVYDQSYYWTIDPAMYDNYNSNLMRDAADFYADYQK